MRETKTCPDQGWEQLPTEELDQILQVELEKDHPNEEVVLPILRILEEREKDYPVEKTPEVLALLKKLSEHETPSKQSKSRHRWIAGIAALAAVVCIIVMALPQTVGAESIFDVLFRWTSSIFEFVDPDDNGSYPNIDNAFVTDHPGLQELHDKMESLGVTESVVPMWLPDGSKLMSLREMPAPSGTKISAVFQAPNNVISLSYRISSETDTKFEKEDSTFEVYDYADISHFIMINDENISIKWIVDSVECSIATDVSKEEVYKIIKSIYKRSL